ncbi:hypothetical protein LTR78_009487 [Recurvomyces mirabilis]|uniref:Uncharacterized protein n=1 Tax=Recurvomyces mirabilis TaxID=574656 RepID=A0AAE0TNN9_9PEZI|nr:hypothetical protein LTR78_009487 [Recurvomyces mirabilis]KAK5152391.1 hypothetical protein LTS14_008338 [Recurvomyces mirabilis]
MAGAPPNYIDHIVRFPDECSLARVYQSSYATSVKKPPPVSVRKSELGRIKDAHPNGKDFRVELYTRADKPIVQASQSDMEKPSDTKYGDGWTYEYKLEHVANISSLGPKPKAESQGIVKHVEAIMSGWSKNSGQIPAFEHYEGLLGTPQKNRAAAEHFGQAMKAASQKLYDLLDTPDFTIWNVLQAATTVARKRDGVTTHVDTTEHGGIYLFVYWDFSDEAEYQGVWIYVGQSTNVSVRVGNHIYAAKSNEGSYKKTYNTDHYKCHRAAGRWKCVRICTQKNGQEGGTQDTAKLYRNLYENVSFLLFRSYHSKVIDVTLAAGRAELRGASEAVLKMYTHVELGLFHSGVMDLAARTTQYADPKTRANFGVSFGLNISSPFGEDTFGWTQKIYTLQRMPEQHMIAFHRPGIVVFKASMQLLETFDDRIDLTKKGLQVYMPADGPSPDVCPGNGDEVFGSWEVMDQGRSHPCPYFPVGSFSGWSNHAEVLRIGLRIIWKSRQTNVWRSRYLRRALMTIYWDEDKPGTENLYCQGTALLAYLLRNKWPQKQSFVPAYGTAQVVEIKYNPFLQVATCSPVLEPIEALQGPFWREQLVMQALARVCERDNQGNEVPNSAKLTHIGEYVDNKMKDELPTEQTKREYNEWFNSDKKPEDRIPRHRVGHAQGTDDRLRQLTSGRKSCDRCAIKNYVEKGGSRVRMPDVAVRRCKCEKITIRKADGSGNWSLCKDCFVQGLPCTWTYFRDIFGPRYFETPRPVGQFFGKLIDIFFRQRESKSAKFLTAQVIPDPGYMVIKGGLKAEDEDVPDEDVQGEEDQGE